MPALVPDLRVSFVGGLLDLWRLARVDATASIIGGEVLPLELLDGPGIVLCVPHVLHMCIYIDRYPPRVVFPGVVHKL